MTGLALTVAALAIALLAAGWAGLFALAEEATGSEWSGSGSVTLHRSFQVSRLALLVVAGVAASEAIGWWFRPVLEGWGLAVVAAAFLYMVADALPRGIGALAPDAATAASTLAQRTLLPFRPLLSLTAAGERLIQRLVPASPPGRAAMGPAHRDMLLGVFSLGDTTVSEVMTPRLDIAAVEGRAGWQDVLDLLGRTEHARVPVYADTLDNVIGILHAKDLVPAAGGVQPVPERWQDLARPAEFVPESKTLGTQLRDFQRGPSHLAIVVDEFGGTSGLITLEDILEEVVGEIHDERDVDEKPAVERQGEDRFWVDGRYSLDELEALLEASVGREDVTTVGGLIYSELGRVPTPGEELRIGPFRVVVEQVVRRRIRRVYFERLQPTPELPVVAEEAE
ncbi:MAG: HlyC/CorC family transporter [Gemmatimonadetes bacterium]|nr:HlyC/CorC family transporter [Gemmatimonadota bacterium]